MSFYCNNMRRPFKQGKTFLDKRKAWMIQQEDSDTRKLFKHKTTRKPFSWDVILPSQL